MDDLTAFLAARLDEDEAGAKAFKVAWWRRYVEALRAILARYQDCLARMEDPDYPAGVARDQAREYEDFVLPNLAAAWSDHPDYRPEWKP